MNQGYAKITAGMLNDGQVNAITNLAGFRQRGKFTKDDIEALIQIGLLKRVGRGDADVELTADGKKVTGYL